MNKSRIKVIIKQSYPSQKFSCYTPDGEIWKDHEDWQNCYNVLFIDTIITELYHFGIGLDEIGIGIADEILSTAKTQEYNAYNKVYAVGQYVDKLGLSIAEMIRRGDHELYPWNSGGKNNPHRKEMIDEIHKKAMDAISRI